MNASDYLLQHGRPDDIAVIEAGAQHTYAQLCEAAAVLAHELRELDLPPGSRVGLLGVNSLFWIASYLATMKLGHVAVPLATHSTPDDLRRNARRVDCRAVLLSRRDRRRSGDAFEAGVALVTDEVLAQPRGHHWPASAATERDDDAVLMFTSGTTAGPKAVRVTHRNIRANTESIIEYLQLASDDRMLVILPFFYCFGASLLHTHLRVGASVALCNTFTFPETAIETMRREHCTGFAGVPSSYQLLLRASSFARTPLPELRHLQQAGGKLPAVQVKELVAAQPHARLYVMYGQTEATARLSYLPPDLVSERPGSIGRGIPGVSLRVVDDAGEPVAAGETGEIRARGDNISPGYFDDPAATAEKFADGELRTGDLATVDDDGFIYVVDRLADFIKSWGYRISSQDIEACVLEIPELVSAAAVGVPDLAAGESVALFVTKRPGAGVTTEDVLAHCRRNLAKHMIPETVRILRTMPLNDNGKVAKRRLRELVPGYTSEDPVTTGRKE